MTQAADFVHHHLRLGYTRAIWALDSVFVLLILVDVCLYARQGARVENRWLPYVSRALWPLDYPLKAEYFWHLALFLLILSILCPIIIAVLRVSGLVPSFTRFAATRPSTVLFVHVAICGMLAYSCFVVRNMEILSGLKQVKDAFEYDFESHFLGIVDSPKLGDIRTPLAGLVGTALTALLTYLFWGEGPSRKLKQYMLRLSLTDLPADLRPLRWVHRLDRPHVRPSIPAVDDLVNQNLREYLGLYPGAAATINLLDKEFEDCKERMLNLLTVPARDTGTNRPNPDLHMGLFTGTRRAFEAALAQTGGSKTIVLSPYASPSLINAARWHASMTGSVIRNIDFQLSDYFRTWQEQESIILAQMDSILRQASRTTLFVVSEVSYATGLRIPLRSFLEALRNRTAGLPVHVIIDGKNSVGNGGLITSDADWDSYVFGPHRWLLAPERCGVLLSKSELDSNVTPAASWEKGSRKSEAQVRILAGFKGSLAILQKCNFEYFQSRCQNLRDELKVGLPDAIQVVGNRSGMEETFLLSCCPREGHTWRFNANDLEKKLVKRSLPASLLKLEPLPWVRVPVPYYFDVREVNRLSDFLKENTN